MMLETASQYLDLKWLSRLFYGFSIFWFAAVLTVHLWPENPKRMPAGQEALPMDFPALKDPFAVYDSVISGSPLFGYEPEAAAASSAAQETISELVKDYRLKGIVVLDEPEALIEDARTQTTVMVKAAGVLGEVKVQEIRTDSVLLAYGNERKELRIE